MRSKAMDEKAKDGAGREDGEGLDALETRFREWRKQRRRGEHIPPQLWSAASAMARQHGVARTAKRLGLNAYVLRKRMEDAAGEVPTDKTEPEFVELTTMSAEPAPTPLAAGVHECVVELRNARGATMRVELNAGGLAGLAHLCRTFWGAA
jgi:hypothetical protein